MTWPDFDAILNTCRRTISKEEEDLCREKFEELYVYACENGDIPDEKWYQLGFPADRNENGEDVFREVGISRENHQRAKNLSHLVEQGKRREKKDKLERVRVEKRSREELAVNKILDDNMKCCRALLRFTLPPEVDCCLVLNELPLLVFEKNATAPQLLAFIKARTFTKSTADKGQSIKQNKGKASEVVTGQENLVGIAFNLRSNNLTLKPTQHIEIVEATPPISIHPIRFQNVQEQNIPLASTYLENHVWLEMLPLNIHGVIRREATEMSAIKKEYANNIHQLMLPRFERLVSLRVEKEKQDHWCLAFQRRNLPRFASMATFFDMMQRNLSRVNENSCLLRHPHGVFLPVAENIRLEGAYGHYFKEECEWVRAGKAAGTDTSTPPADFINRNGQHLTAALRSEVTAEKSFYTYFPSMRNPHNIDGIRRGYFEDLEQYSLLAFDRNGHVDELIKVEGGIFDWGDDIQKISSLSFYGSKTLREKQLVVISYFYEMCFDICIAPDSNVSQSTGWEAVGLRKF